MALAHEYSEAFLKIWSAILGLDKHKATTDAAALELLPIIKGLIQIGQLKKAPASYAQWLASKFNDPEAINSTEPRDQAYIKLTTWLLTSLRKFGIGQTVYTGNDSIRIANFFKDVQNLIYICVSTFASGVELQTDATLINIDFLVMLHAALEAKFRTNTTHSTESRPTPTAQVQTSAHQHSSSQAPPPPHALTDPSLKLDSAVYH